MHPTNLSDPVFSRTENVVRKFFLVLNTVLMYIACVTCFLISGSKKAIMQYQIVVGMIFKAKKTRRVNYNKYSIIQR